MKTSRLLPALLSLFLVQALHAQQVGINTDTPEASAVLHVESTTQGVLVPRLTTVLRTAIPDPANGLLVYDTDTDSFWYFDTGGWKNLGNTTGLADGDGDTQITLDPLGGDPDRIGLTMNGWTGMYFETNPNHVPRLRYFQHGGNISIGLTADNLTQAGTFGNEGLRNILIGDYVARDMSSGYDNLLLGYRAGSALTTASKNVALGNYAGASMTSASGGVFLGNQAGRNETFDNRLYIHNDSSSVPLIYGEFDSRVVRINGTLELWDSFRFPMDGGQFGNVLTSDGVGTTMWAPVAPMNLIQNQAGDNKIEVDENTDSIGVFFGGEEHFRFESLGGNQGRLSFPSSSSIYIGNDAGPDINTTFNTYLGMYAGNNNNSSRGLFMGYSSGVNGEGNWNTFLGYRSGGNSIGEYNTCLGPYSGRNIQGDDNICLGNSAGESAAGADNIFIGNDVGRDYTGSNQLMIDNSNLGSALIHGFFDTDKLRVNGTLEIGTAYHFPATDGANSQVLTTNGSGTLQWGDNTTSRIQNSAGNSWVSVSNSGDGKEVAVYLDNQIHFVMSENDYGLATFEVTGNERNVMVGTRIDNLDPSGAGDLGKYNTFLGAEAGGFSTTGSHNTFVGYETGELITDGVQNTLLGSGAGRSTHGSGNVFIGYHAGYWEDVSNKLYINNGTGTPLIYGDFENNRVGIQREATTNAFEVQGNASKSSAGDWLANSDRRLKKNIQPLDSKTMLEKLLQLQGVQYEWNDDKTGYERPEGFQLGFIAQEIQEVFPDFVQADADGYLQTAYGTYDPIYVEAFRELHNRIEVLEKENSELLGTLSDLQTAVLQLQAAVGKVPDTKQEPAED